MHNLAGVLIPIVVVPVVMAVPVLIVFFGLQSERHKRELLSRERLAAIEKGMEVPILDAPQVRAKGSPLRSALVTTAAGLGLMIFFYSVSPSGRGPWGIGTIVALVGLAMLVHWFIAGKEEWQRQRSLDEDLQRAYIDRLRGTVAATAKTETPRAD